MKQADLKPKLDYMRMAISASQLGKIDCTPAAWHGKFTNIAIAQTLGFATEGNNYTNVQATVSKLLSGSRGISQVQLNMLAKAFHLTPAVESEADAGHALTDACSYEEFTHRLIDSGWADPEAAAYGVATSRELLLATFRPFNLRRGGIRMGDNRQLEIATPGLMRGSRLPRAEDSEKLQDIAIGMQVGLRIEPLAERRGLLLMEIGPGGSEACVLHCLIPSILSPAAEVAPEQILPAACHMRIDRFVFDGPAGYYDWLAILTREPLAPPWQTDLPDFYRLTRGNFEWLLDALGRQQASPATGDAVEIRHHPFTVGLRPVV